MLFRHYNRLKVKPYESGFLQNTSKIPQPEAEITGQTFRVVSSFPPYIYEILEIPSVCRADVSLVKLTCTGEDFQMTIFPRGTGHAVDQSTRDEVLIQGKRWYRTKFIQESQTGISYGLDANITYILVEVLFDKYSTTGEKLGEEILSTIRLKPFPTKVKTLS